MATALKIFAGLVGLLVLLLGVFVVAFWAPERSVEDLKKRWAPPPSTFVDVLGMQVHLRDEGPRDDKSPIVLMHGTGSSLHAWEPWVAALKDKRRVITLDLPGYGLTGPTPDNIYGREVDVRFVIAVLDKLGVERAVLGGNSLGAGVSVWTALAHPSRVDGLILVDGGYPTPATSTPIGMQLLRIPGMGLLLQHTLPRFLVEQGLRNTWGDPNKITEENIVRAIELTQRAGNRRALIERYRQRRPNPQMQRLSEIKVPTLIMWGGRDRLVPIIAAQRLHSAIAGSTLVVFDELGHAPEEEDPAGTVEAVKKFLKIE